MSIPQICPSCGEHINTPHAKDCSFGTPEYAHIGWPGAVSQATSDALLYGTGVMVTQSIDRSCVSDPDTASAIRRLLEYLNDEPEIPERHHNGDAILLLTKRSEELRKEAEGISSIYTLARSNRNFAADVLDRIIAELSA